ncbi:MAG TPA: hypothetical protein VGE93_15245 [Bryobacteraceae bacterium]
MAVSPGDIKNLNERATKIADRASTLEMRVTKIETVLSGAKWVASIGTIAVLTWGAFITTNVIAMKQNLADGGAHQLVTQLQKADSPKAVAANMNLLKSEVQVEVVSNKKPNRQKIRAISAEVEKTLARFPEVDESWSAAAELVSYSTSSTPVSPEQPLCDTNVEAGYIPPLPEIGKVPFLGYLFRNCRLRLSSLPSGNVIRGENYTIGRMAYAVNVTIVLDDSGISETDISNLVALNCRFEFSVSKTPKTRAQRLLLAALQNPDALEKVQLPV